MRVHVIRHVEFEGPGAISEWAARRGHELTESFALTEEFPEPADVGLLVVLGGPMDADDHVASPWLGPEKAYLARALEGGSTVLAICLGAQIVAEVIGGKVTRGAQPEIGWFPVEVTPAGAESCLEGWPRSLTVGHWHGDTFVLPDGLASAASSEATPNQAFCALDGRVLALQFHLEWTADDVAKLVDVCGSDLVASEFVLPAEQILAGAERYLPACHQALFGLLDRLSGEQ